MQVSVPTSNGLLLDKYGKYAPKEAIYNKTRQSLFRLKLRTSLKKPNNCANPFDFDSVPVCGFAWIHWIAANIPAASTVEIPENASQKGGIQMIQGNNSTAGPLIGETDPLTTQHYIGPTPPDKTHDYWLDIYALDSKLDLKEGFWLNEFYHAAKPHIIERKRISILSRA